MSEMVDPREAIVDAIEGLARQFRYELLPSEHRMYVDGLADIPLDELRAGIAMAVVSRGYMPLIAELRRDVDAALDRVDVEACVHRLLPGEVPKGPYVCPQCSNTSWVLIEGERKPMVKRCVCIDTNPTLKARRRYAVEAGTRAHS